VKRIQNRRARGDLPGREAPEIQSGNTQQISRIFSVITQAVAAATNLPDFLMGSKLAHLRMVIVNRGILRISKHRGTAAKELQPPPIENMAGILRICPPLVDSLAVAPQL